LILANFPSTQEIAALTTNSCSSSSSSSSTSTSNSNSNSNSNSTRILANVTLKAPILSASIVRVPLKHKEEEEVEEEKEKKEEKDQMDTVNHSTRGNSRIKNGCKVENCLVVVDQSNCVTCLSLFGLEILFSHQLSFSSSFLDGIQFKITLNGELIVLRQMAGEIQRFSLFEEQIAQENAFFLQQKTIKTKIFQPERNGGGYIGGNSSILSEETSSSSSSSSTSTSNSTTSPKTKKKNLSIFQKILGGVNKEQAIVDLNQIFTFSTEEQERKLLFGGKNRTLTNNNPSTPSVMAAIAEEKKLNYNLTNTKDILQQAGQVLFVLLYINHQT
jgi:hypothetical protein